ncbi:GPI mannosyltransferase 1 isoform X2 [Aplysia californica]|uniref:GPI alpha-1,4-mannosyltransferase I, catalytic subunit n=1 Tax=Aplysia californica TaxID=6500 RepID=A0ABM1VWN4_APLCA|nr:GPI mannosyltransferase 1 isoform X2 [Aplysia californica]
MLTRLQRRKMLTIKQWCILAFVVRLAMIAYGQWQDANMAVKYTDVDYYVFTDAAEYVTKGESPYLRSTYRYPPILAWILTLNIWLSPVAGKIIFVAFDILVGSLIYKIVRKSGCQENMAKNCALAWLLNLLPATVSSRGNAESVMAFLVLQSLDYLINGRTVLAAIFYSLSVHFKIYPVTFALPIYLYLGKSHSSMKKDEDPKTPVPFSRKNLRAILLPSPECRLFIGVASLVLGALTGICFFLYGRVFLYETYFYHIVRGDIKHNFSPYFYLLYLLSDPSAGLPLCLRLLLFVPQVLLLFAISWRFQHDPPISWFLCTFCFVMANKVCTSQYFLWYLSLLPVIIPSLKINALRVALLVVLWFLAQGLWLLSAYYLEFMGHNTYIWIWAASLLFFAANGLIASNVIDSYQPV